MPHVFLSYSRKDSEFVEKIERDLNACGIVTWRDKTSIVGSEDWYASIVRGLESAYAVILVVTPNSDESRWVRREALYADELGVPTLPVWPEQYTARLSLHFLLIEKQPIYCDHAQYASGLAQIASKLVELAKAAPPASLATTPAARPGTVERALELAYLNFLLSEAKADLRTALYVGLRATPERTAQKVLSLGLPGQRRPMLGRLGIQVVTGEHCEQMGETVEDARVPLREMGRVLLLGEPGSGKTTTLLQLAVDMAQEAQTDPAKRLPVFVPLRSYSGEQPFLEFVRGQMGILQSHCETLLAQERLVLLCDALNEMPRAANTHNPVAEVRTFLEKRSPWVVSCRVRDYQEELKDLPEVGRVRLKPLDLPRIQEVVQKRFQGESDRAQSLWAELRGSDDLLAAWQAFEKADKTEVFWGQEWPDGVEGKYDAPWQAGRTMHADRRRMLSLCQNPYMLFLVCEIFEATHSLPENRGALFAAFVDDLLAREEETSRATGRAWIETGIIRQALAQLAYAMQTSETGTEITRAEAEQLLAAQPDISDPTLLLRLAASASLLDVGERVRYTHQLLQEYFASEVLGGVMNENRPATQFWPPDKWWQAQGWEETAIILAGVRGDPEGVARWIAPVQPDVAYQALTESGLEVDLKRLQPETRAALVNSAQAKKDEPNPVGRAAAYRILGRFRVDHRPGVLAPNGVPQFVWCEVPAGKFKMGGDLKALNDWDGAEFDLPYPFWMAKYPVTYAQYEAFVAAGGYQERRYWTEAGWEWKSDKTQPEYGWNDPQWHIANHPVIGVTWYEAYAYTQWFNEQVPSTPALLPQGERSKVGYVIRLPRECEWEKAARYPDGRLFPWGNDWDAARLNSNGTGIGRTSAVGIFPNGANPAHRACDLSGNVWEWCLTKWADRYQSPQAENNDPQGGSVRVAHGGSWNIGGSIAGAATRDWDYPAGWSLSRGFRVVLSASL